MSIAKRLAAKLTKPTKDELKILDMMKSWLVGPSEHRTAPCTTPDVTIASTATGRRGRKKV